MIWAMFSAGFAGIMAGGWNNPWVSRFRLRVDLALIYAGTALCIVAMLGSLYARVSCRY